MIAHKNARANRARSARAKLQERLLYCSYRCSGRSCFSCFAARSGLVHLALVVLAAFSALDLLAVLPALVAFLASRSMIAQVSKSTVLLK